MTGKPEHERSWVRFFVTFLIYCLLWGVILMMFPQVHKIVNPERRTFYPVLLLPPAFAAGIRVLLS